MISHFALQTGLPMIKKPGETMQNGLSFMKPNQQKMKKMLIGAIVGGVLLMVWQTLSWTVLQLHYKGTEYTPKQDTIMAVLSTQLEKDGSYFMPGHPKDASNEVIEQTMKDAIGKPWAVVSYHSSLKDNMGMNIARGFLVDIILAWLLCWGLSKMNAPSFSTILMASLGTGLIVFLNGIYTMHIWFESFDLMNHFLDYIVSWGLVGLWLGWWWRK